MKRFIHNRSRTSRPGITAVLAIVGIVLAIGLVVARRALAKRRNARAAASPAPIAPGGVR